MTSRPSLAEAVVYRAGQGRSSGALDADPITTEIIRHGLNSAAEQMKRALIRTAFSPVIYEVARLRGRDLRPPRAAARAGAEPAHLHGHDELLRRGRGRGGRRRGGARAGRHHPLQLPLRQRLPPSGRGRGDARLPRGARADRLHDDQRALARHRRQGALLDRHRRCLPGGHDLPGRQALLARRARQGHLPHGDRQQPRAEDGRRRHQRRGRQRAHRGCGPAAARRTLRPRGLRDLRRAHVRPRRGDRAQLLQRDPRRTLRG